MANDPTDDDWAPSTVTEAVSDLEAEGYTADFSVAPGGQLHCGACGSLHDPAEILVDRIARFEGETDPGDESIVFALTCGDCGLKGTLVSAYGPSVGADEAKAILALSTRG